jgi:hypothetical protein
MSDYRNFDYRDPKDDRVLPPRQDLPPDDSGASYGLAGLLLGAIFVAAILAFVFSGNTNNEMTQTAANTPSIVQPNNPPPANSPPTDDQVNRPYRTEP